MFISLKKMRPFQKYITYGDVDEETSQIQSQSYPNFRLVFKSKNEFVS